MFHTSCLIHWILLCEYEILTNKPVGPKERQKPRRKNAGKCDKMEKVGEVVPTGVQTHIRSVFCPECHGTGINTEGDKLENTKYLQSQVTNNETNCRPFIFQSSNLLFLLLFFLAFLPFMCHNKFVNT